MAENHSSKKGASIIPAIIVVVLGLLSLLVIIAALALFTSLRGNMSGGWGTGGGNGGQNLNYPSGANPEEVGDCLDEYMKATVPGSPLIGYGKNFASAGKGSNVNPALMVAIGQQESSLGTAGIVRDHPYNYYGLTKPGGGWAEFGSWEEAIDYQAKYLREEYLDKDLTTIPQIGAKYAPHEAETWSAGVQSHFDSIVGKCPALEPGEVIAGACSVGYQGQPASCGWIQLPNKPEDYQKYNTPGEDWGKINLVNMVMGVAESWKKTSLPKIQVGGLSGECHQAGGHASHDRGTDVDIDLPGGMMVDGPNYHQQWAIDLAKKFIACGATDIGYDDLQVLQTVNSWAEQNGYPGRVKAWSDHEDHFHVRSERR